MPSELAIIIPYRDRAEHLEEFLPYISEFFATDIRRNSRRILIKIIEQSEEREFNRGLLKNIGYLFSKKFCRYVAFHDVDYLPKFADYSKPKGWAAIATKGPEKLVDTHSVTITHDIDSFFGGVVLFRNAAFEKVNGYSNSYWGWGYEDQDLASRCQLLGIPFERRNGEFKLLAHKSNGWDVECGPTIAHMRNLNQFLSRFPVGLPSEIHKETSLMERDGLNDAKFSVIKRTKVSDRFSCRCDLDAELITVSV